MKHGGEKREGTHEMVREGMRTSEKLLSKRNLQRSRPEVLLPGVCRAAAEEKPNPQLASICE